MRTPTHRFVALVLAAGAVASATSALAQTVAPAARSNILLAQAAPAPSREAPSPADLEPRVNTSAPSSEAARETPRPDDVNPRVDTSSPAQSPDRPAAPPASGARAPRAAGTAGQPAAPAANAPAAANPSAGASGAKPAAKTGKGQDRLELDTTQITGNRELPKVLYIVPWKRSDLGDLVGKPVNSLLDEVLTPVDRDVFRRENRYYRALTPGADQGVGPDYADGSAPYVRPTPGSALPGAGSVGSATSKPATPGSPSPSGNTSPPGDAPRQ
jgi:hypothetical protein